MGGEFEPVCGVDLGAIVGLLKLLIDVNLFLVTSILLFKSNCHWEFFLSAFYSDCQEMKSCTRKN